MPRIVIRYAGRDWPDPRGTRAWRKLRDQVVAEEPWCWLNLPDICTRHSQTADHIEPVARRPDLAMDRANLRGVCHRCNRERSSTPVRLLLARHVRPRPTALRFFD